MHAPVEHVQLRAPLRTHTPVLHVPLSPHIPFFIDALMHANLIHLPEPAERRSHPTHHFTHASIYGRHQYHHPSSPHPTPLVLYYFLSYYAVPTHVTLSLKPFASVVAVVALFCCFSLSLVLMPSDEGEMEEGRKARGWATRRPFELCVSLVD